MKSTVFWLRIYVNLLVSLPLSPSMYQTAALDDETAEMFKEKLVYPVQMLDIIQNTLLGIGVAIFLICLISYCVVRRKEGKLV